MSIALLITTAGPGEPSTRLIPVATQQIFRERWLPGARALRLELVALVETGIDITDDNLAGLVDELRSLRAWMDRAPGPTDYDRQRMETLLGELELLHLGDGVTAFLG